MENVVTKDIRNVVLLGHSGSGKTSLVEALLFLTKNIDRLGTVTGGNTCCDYDPEEIKRGFSLSASMAPLTWNQTKINFLDTPGYFDFEGEVLQCVRVADSALIVVDGKSGVQVGTEMMWHIATEAGTPKAFFINRFDDPETRFDKVFESLQAKFGLSVCPVQMPIGEPGAVIGFADLLDLTMYTYDPKSNAYTKGEIPQAYRQAAADYRNQLLESIAQTSDELMEKFFAEEEISADEAQAALRAGILQGDIVPVYCGAATKMWGMNTLLDHIACSFPSPLCNSADHIVDEAGEKQAVTLQEEGDVSLFFFKTIADPFVGKMSFFKVMSGTLTKDMVLRNTTTGANEKLNRIYEMRGKKQVEIDSICCGGIGVTAKLSNTNTNDTLTTSAQNIRYAPIVFPMAYMTMSVVPKAKGDEDKISLGIARLLEEDPTLQYENNPETKQLLLSGLGDMHLDVMVAKLKNRYGTSVELGQPKIAYRETIKKKVDVEGKHKKQSGGSGQYGHVKITFSPGEAEGLTFTESVFGGSVPRQYFPAVEKGLLDCISKGVLAGYPMVHLAANLYDGSYHEVDSNEISFKLAAGIAYREGLPKASPVLLEPIGTLKVYVPDDYVGDVMGDLNKRRGKVMGMEPYAQRHGYQTIIAEVPKAEMTNYVITLRALTQGRGRFDYAVQRYEEVPAALAEKVIAEAKRDAEP
ncbi:MAG: elongation factor G [Eubacteriales bacterium]